MGEKRRETVYIVSQEEIAKDIFSLWLQTETIAENAKPGQFISLYSRNESKLLPRPISICEIDREKKRLRLVYRVTGKHTGTEEFSRLHARVGLQAIGPLGNGFPLDMAKGKRVLLMGGGIGIPPMLQVAKALAAGSDPQEGAKICAVLGYRDTLFLDQEFQNITKTVIATEDGSAGTKGTVMDAIRENHLDAEIIFACGPAPMLRAIQAYAAEKQIPCWISMEERMACGIGACLACVCRSKEVDEHSHVHNKRVCKDGPVFLSTEVEL